jgi:hypothetical protein
LNKKLENIIDSIASVLSDEKAYNIPKICMKYDLGIGEDYTSPSSKFKFLKWKIEDKEEDFILKLAFKIVNDYKSNYVGHSLNQFHNGKFYKLSEITRRNLLNELYEIDNINGSLTIDEFLELCEMEYLTPIITEMTFRFFLIQPVNHLNSHL